jgi:hypothetical protein
MSYYTHYLLSQTVPTPPRRAYQPRRRLLLRVAPPPPPLPASVRRRMLRRADHLAPPPLQSAAPATFPPFSNRSSGLLRCWRGEIRRRRGRIWSPCAELEGVVVLMAGAHGVRWWAGVAACGDRATTEAAHGVRGKEWRRAVNHHRLCLRPCPPRLAPPRRARSVRPRR